MHVFDEPCERPNRGVRTVAVAAVMATATVMLMGTGFVQAQSPEDATITLSDESPSDGTTLWLAVTSPTRG